MKSLPFYSLKPEKVPLSGGASPYRLLKGRPRPDFSNRVASNESLSAKVVNLVLSQKWSGYKFKYKKNQLKQEKSGVNLIKLLQVQFTSVATVFDP